MMLTEDQARTKWCPHVQVCVNQNAVDALQAEPIYDNRRCIASECMSWRWENKPGRGYCGLAGKPADCDREE